MKNLYAALGVDDKAGPEELRRAWLRLAVKYHPDRNPGDARAEERFKEISQAYALLSDPAARARYERTRPTPGPAAPRAEPKTQARDQNTKPKAEPKPAPKPEPKARPAGFQASGPSRPKAENEESSDWTEFLNSFFQTPKGRDTLKDLEEELRRAGLKFSSGRLANWLQKRKPYGFSEKAKTWLARFRTWLPGGPAWLRLKAARYDLDFDLAVSSFAAAKGTTVDITLPREDGRQEELKINIPPNTKNGARLRLADQGRLRPDGGRGDLVLTIETGPRPSVADLWS
jgi:curved DNA-binding protein